LLLRSILGTFAVARSRLGNKPIASFFVRRFAVYIQQSVDRCPVYSVVSASCFILRGRHHGAGGIAT